MPYDHEEEAVTIANDTVYGLSGGVWSGDKKHAERWRVGSGRGKSRLMARISIRSRRLEATNSPVLVASWGPSACKSF